MSEQERSSDTQEQTPNPEQNREQNNSELGNDKDRDNRIKEGRIAQLSSLLEEPQEDEETDKNEDEDSDRGKSDDKDKDKDKDKKDLGDLKTLTDLAKALKVDQAKLYDIKVTLKDRETNVSLGELKDAFQESQDIDFERIEWGETKAKEEQNLARARKELETLVSLIPKDSLKKEQVEAAQNIVKGQLERARADVLKRIPEWDDLETRKEDIKNIDKDHLAKYGIKVAELTDPRLVHYIRNNWLREQRIEQALAKIRKVEKGKTPEPSAGTGTRPRRGKQRQVSDRAKNIARNLLGQLED